MSAFWSGFLLGMAALLVIEGLAGLAIMWVVLPRLRARRNEQILKARR